MIDTVLVGTVLAVFVWAVLVIGVYVFINMPSDPRSQPGHNQSVVEFIVAGSVLAMVIGIARMYREWRAR